MNHPRYSLDFAPSWFLMLFGLVSLFNDISFLGYLMPKPFLKMNSNDTFQPVAVGG